MEVASCGSFTPSPFGSALAASSWLLQATPKDDDDKKQVKTIHQRQDQRSVVKEKEKKRKGQRDKTKEKISCRSSRSSTSATTRRRNTRRPSMRRSRPWRPPMARRLTAFESARAIDDTALSATRSLASSKPSTRMASQGHAQNIETVLNDGRRTRRPSSPRTLKEFGAGDDAPSWSLRCKPTRCKACSKRKTRKRASPAIATKRTWRQEKPTRTCAPPCCHGAGLQTKGCRPTKDL